MDKYDKQIAIENFVTKVSSSVEEIEKLISFLRIEDDKQKEMLKLSLKILNKKMTKLRKCKSVKDTEKHIKTNKVVKKYTGYNTEYVMVDENAYK